MSRRARFRQQAWWILPVFLFLVLPFVSGCGGGGSAGTPDDKDLQLTYFSHGDRTDVYRNQVLEFRFTSPVNPDSVSERTFRILYGPLLQTPHLGAAVVDGNKILFHPTRSQASYDRDGPGGSADIPFGFAAATLYQVYLPGPPVLRTMTNLAGHPIVSEYIGTFTTSEKYVPELDQPRYLGPDGLGQGLGFEPPQFFDPDLGRTVATYDAWIFLQFDEAIAPGTMDPGVTVAVDNLTTGFPVPGTLSPSIDGSLYIFKPTVGYGGGPYRISVSLTRDITDLAGNPLLNAPLTMYFDTEYKPGVPTPGTLIESFDDTDMRYTPGTTGDWDGTYPGELRSGPITTRIVTVNPQGDGVNSRETLTDYPLVRPDQGLGCNIWPKGCRVMQSYTTSDLGTAPGTITEYAWGPNSNALFLASHDNIQLTFGRVADPKNDGNPKAVIVPTFKNNWDGDVPPPHYSGRYDIPQRLNIDPPGLDTGFWPYPKSARPFDYDGTRGIVIDMNMDAGTDCQTIRGWNWGVPGAAAAPGIRNLVAKSKNAAVDDFSGVPAGTGQMYILDARFTIRRRVTTAESLWYDSTVATPTYSAPIVSPPQQSNAASYVLELQGAVDRTDSDTYTEWTEDMTDFNGNRDEYGQLIFYRFFRFRITLNADLDTDTLARITQISFPFEF